MENAEGNCRFYMVSVAKYIYIFNEIMKLKAVFLTQQTIFLTNSNIYFISPSISMPYNISVAYLAPCESSMMQLWWKNKFIFLHIVY